jgi:WD40 repeat protein
MANRSAWKDVHLFVSSTFRDTQAERDVLVRRVFPVLRAELLQHKVRLIDIDLRWGIEGQDESGVVGICMDVLNQALPRFIGIIGDRYGWIPSGSKVSVTEQEIMAALNHSDCHPLFLLRNPARPEGSEALDFLDDSDAGVDASNKASQLNRLRKHIEETSTARVYRYRCSINEGRVKPDAAFETHALEGLRESLRSLYTTDDVMMDAAPSDTVGHALSFASERAAEWLGGLRDDELTRVSDFLTSESGHIHILGAGGSGKTSLLAKALDGILEQSITDGRVVLAAFCGAHRGTQSGESVLRGMVDRLVDASIPASDDHDPSRPSTDFAEIRKWFSRRIADTKAILIIDGIDQLPERDRFLTWLPNPLPDGVTVLTGSLDSESTNRLSEHWKSRASDAITLAPINHHSGTNFVTNHLARYRKSLSVDALSTLMAKPGASTPLYLRIAAEELRTKGVRENLVNDIAGMPGTAGGMFLWVLMRLANDHQFGWSDGQSVVGALAGCLGVARDGLSEAELVALLSTIDPKGQDPDGDTAVLLRLLRPYLGRRGDRYAPLHRVFSEALWGDGLTDADRSLLGSEHPAPLDELHEVQRAHAQLVSLFAGMPADHLRRLSEEAWHRICSGDLDGACALLTDFSLLKSRVEAGLVRGVLEDMDALVCAASVVAWPVPENLRVWQRLFRRRREFWEQFPEEFHQDCLNEAEGLPTTESAKANPIDKPWIRWVNKPEHEIRHSWEWMVRGASCATFSPDGKSVVVGGTDGSLRLLDAETGYEVWKKTGHEGEIGSVVFSPDGFRLLTASSDETARVWDAFSGAERLVIHGLERVVGHTHTIHEYSAIFDSDGSKVLTVFGSRNGRSVRIWDAMNGSELLTLHGNEDFVHSATFSPDGAKVLTAATETIRIWDSATGAELLVLSELEDGGSGTFSPDGSKVLTYVNWSIFRQICYARIWDATSGTLLQMVGCDDDVVRYATFNHDGSKVLTAGYDGSARIWDVANGAELLVLQGHKDAVRSATFSSDGCKVLTASHDGTLRIWDALSGQEMMLFQGHWDWLHSATFSPDESKVLTTSRDNTARVWNVSSNSEQLMFSNHYSAVEDIKFSADASKVLIRSSDTIRIWDTSSGAELLVIRANKYAVGPAIFSPDGSKVLTATRDAVWIWDVSSGKEMFELRGHEDMPSSAVFSPDGSKVLTISDDGMARIWDALSGKEMIELRGNEKMLGSAIFSPVGSKVLTYSWRAVQLWDVSTGEELACLPFSPLQALVPHLDCFEVKQKQFRWPFFGAQNQDSIEAVDTPDAIFYRWEDGAQILDAIRTNTYPKRSTFIEYVERTGICLMVAGLPAFTLPVLHIGTGFRKFRETGSVNPNDPLSFVAGCGDGSVRFFRLEGVDLPANR